MIKPTISREEYETAVNMWSVLVKTGHSDHEMVPYCAARINQYEYEQEMIKLALEEGGE